MAPAKRNRTATRRKPPRTNSNRLLAIGLGLAVALGVILLIVLLFQTGASDDTVAPPVEIAPSTLAERTPVAAAVGTPTAPNGWPISTTSGEAEIDLAAHLVESDATMYGAWWCPNCYAQKQLFGEEAFAAIKPRYVECSTPARTPTGNGPPEVAGFPTWEIDGQFLVGLQSLDDLARASGYEGRTDFLYRRAS